MTMEDFYLFHEDNFDSFSKKTIKKASANIRRKLAAQSDRETELSVLPFQDLQKLCTEDTYQEDEESVVFHVRGLSVVVHDSALGQALFALPPKRRDVVLLFYFAEQNDPQIGRLLNLDTSTINRRRSAALSNLKAILEAMGYGA